MKRLFVLTISLMLISAGTAFALPLTVDKVNSSDTAIASFTTYNSGADVTVHTQYSLETTPLGVLDAFCVEGVASGTGPFEIIEVPSDNLGLRQAAWVVDQFWTIGSGWTYNKEDTQILAWELALGDIFTYKSGATFSDDAAVQDAIVALNIGSPSQNVSLVHNPVGSDAYGKQDFLVNHDVPEPTTLLFLGLSMLGIGVTGRRRYRDR